MLLILLSAFPGHVCSQDAGMKRFQLQQIRSLSVWVCSLHAWCVSLAATSQPNVLISLESCRGEESGVMSRASGFINQVVFPSPEIT